MTQKIKVLIIEDDFRIADINRELVEQIDGFQVAAIAKTGNEAIAFLEQADPLPALVFLDVYIPDRAGLDLFREIRHHYPAVDVIMLTAANDAGTIQQALRGGIFDFLVKPVNFERFEQSLLRYREQLAVFTTHEELGQPDIDRLLGQKHVDTPAGTSDLELPKGIDPLTLNDVFHVLLAAAAPGVNAMETGKAVGVSRSTARRYLEHLVSTGDAKAQLNYGEIGRPERRYVPWTK